jgi:hypothetical protein
MNYTAEGLAPKHKKTGVAERKILTHWYWHRCVNFEFEYLSELEVMCEHSSRYETGAQKRY